MGRPKDKHYWDKVTIEADGRLKCKRCGHQFRGGVPRIRAHVDLEQGKGVKRCKIDSGSVPDNEGGDNNIAAGSSNPQPHGAVNAVNSLQGCTVPAGYPMMGSGNSGVENEISDLKQMKEQLQLLQAEGEERKRQVDDWLKQVTDLKERARQVIESVGQGWSTGLLGLEEEIQQLTKQLLMRNEEKLLMLSDELVGSSFEKNIKEVCELLGDDKVFKIGIHGMGGVGKTCLVTLIKNEIIKKGTFEHVFWVTVSQHFSIFKLQKDVAQRIGVKLAENDDEGTRAGILSSELGKKEKSLFILDNVWNYIDLQKVGIPLRVKGNKLILTSRLKHVCRQMDCRIIRMQPLYYDEDYGSYDTEDEGWMLFSLKCGFHGAPSTFPPKESQIARSVANECEGLPLGISVMARTMRGVNGIRCWRHALYKLRNSKMGEEMEEEVFKILKLSYDNLIDINMQKCFLYCALFNKFERKNMIMNLFEEGLINGMRSLEEIFDEGRAILDKLVDHSLLLEEEEEEEDILEERGRVSFWMHGLMRHIACRNILEERGRYMVKCKKGLKKIPDMQEWTADLEKVSLMDNWIAEIPKGTSPQCPKLSTLIFGRNPFSSIPGCFFNHMNALAILDLSYNRKLESLPDSVANLGSLISLLLKDCHSLEKVPPLGQLQKLSRLVISYTSIKKLPRGLEILINLKWLDLSGNLRLTFLPAIVLPNLTKMQYLDLRSGRVKVKVEDIQGMTMLEYFGGSFHDSNNYEDYVRNTVDMDCALKTYHILSGISEMFEYRDAPVVDIEEQTQYVTFGDCQELRHLLPRGLTKLCIWENKQWRCLCFALSFDLNGRSSLSDIHIEHCTKLESLFCSSGSCSFCTPPQHLQSFPLHGVFCHLRSLQVSRCHKMEKLLTPGSLKQLQNLESLSVCFCDSMKKIFAVRSDEDDDDDYSTITLPKLTEFKLCRLPILKTVCRGTLICGSSEVLDIYGCPDLEMPTVRVFSDSVSNFHEEAH